MSDVVQWVVELAIKDGGLANFKAVMNEMVAATKANEPGALRYEWFISADGRICHISESYADSAAVLTHMKTFGEKFAERLLASADAKRLVVYGTPNSEARAVLAGFGAVHMEPLGGFARQAKR